MAERPKITVKPAAPARDPHRPRVRGVTSPRPAPVARDAPPAAPAGGAIPVTRRETHEPRRDERAPYRDERPPRRDDRAPPRDPRNAGGPDRPAARQGPPPDRPFDRQNTGRDRPFDRQNAGPDRPFDRPHAAPDRPFGRQAPGPDRPLGRPGDRPVDRRPDPRRDAAPRPDPRPAPRVAAAPPSAAAQRPAANPAAAQGVRVSKLMTERGLASRREADDWIAAGWVRVGGQMAELGQRVPQDAVIDIDPRARAEQARQVTVLLHKPMGIVSGQAEDGYEPAVTLVTLANRWSGDTSGIDFHPGHLRHLAPAGRLDIDSTGLLVFTQDGRVAKRLIGDQTRVEKEYLVRVAYTKPGRLPDSDMELLRHGLTLDGVLLRPAAVSWQNEDQLRIVLREGRKRQIRRMCELVGLEVQGLKRVRIGSVPLGQLPPGQWRYLRDDERF